MSSSNALFIFRAAQLQLQALSFITTTSTRLKDEIMGSVAKDMPASVGFATVRGPLGIESASLKGKVALVTGSGTLPFMPPSPYHIHSIIC